MRTSLLLHIISVVVWVGGMFFAYTAVRPAAVEALEPPQRLKLWTGIFRRFFPWVWGAVFLLFATGIWMMFRMGRVPTYVIAMTVIGVVMTAIFMHIVFAPFARLKRAVAAEDWKAGGASLNQIRVLIATNLTLGIANIVVAIVGPKL